LEWDVERHNFASLHTWFFKLGGFTHTASRIHRVGTRRVCGNPPKFTNRYFSETL
jgi:hypothetical protein